MEPHSNIEELLPIGKFKMIIRWFAIVFRLKRHTEIPNEVGEQLVADLSEVLELSPNNVRNIIGFMVENFHGDETAKHLWDSSNSVGEEARAPIEDRLTQHLYQKLVELSLAASARENLSSSAPSDNSMSTSNRVIENQSQQPQDLSALLDSTLISTGSSRHQQYQSLQPQDLSASLDSTLISTGSSRHQQYPSLQSQALSASIDRGLATIGSSRHQEYQSQQSQALSASIDRSLDSAGSSRHQGYLDHRFHGPLQNLSSVVNLSTTGSLTPASNTYTGYQSQLTPGLHENLPATGAIPKNSSSLSQQVSTSNNNRNLSATMPAMSSMPSIPMTWSAPVDEKRPSSPECAAFLGLSDEMKRLFTMPECETPDTNNSSATNETQQSSSEYSSLLGSTDPIERLMMMPKCKTPDTNNKIDSLMMNPRWKFPDANYILGDTDPSLSSFESQSLSERNRNLSYTDDRNMPNQSLDDEMERLERELAHLNISSSDDNEIINIETCFQRASDACKLPLKSGASNLSINEESRQYGLAASSRVSEGRFESPYLQLDVSDDTLRRLGWNTDPTRNLNLDEDFSYGSFNWKVDGRKLSLHVKTAENSNYDIPWSTNDGITEFKQEPIPKLPKASTIISNLDVSRSSYESNVGATTGGAITEVTEGAATEGFATEGAATEGAANTQHNTTDNILEENRQPRYTSPDVESARTNLDLTSRSYGNVNENSCTEDASNTQLNNTDNNLEGSSGAVLGLSPQDWPIVCEFNANKFSNDLGHQDSSLGHVSVSTRVLGKPYYQDMPVDGTKFSPDTNYEQYTIDERGYLRDPTNELNSVDETGHLHDPNYGQYIVDETGTLHYPIYGLYPVDEAGLSHDPNSQVNPVTETGFASGVASDVLESEQDRSYNNNSNWDEFNPKVYQPLGMTLVDFVPSEITVVKTKKTKKKERKLRAMRAAAAAAENTSESSNNSPSLSSVSSSLKDLNLGNHNLNVLEETQSGVSPSERTQSNVSPTEQDQSIASTSKKAQNSASTSEKAQNSASTSEQAQISASTSEEQTSPFKSENAQSSGSSFEQAQSRGSPSKQSQTNASAVNQHQRGQRGGRGGRGDRGGGRGRGGRGSSSDRRGHEGSDERGGRGGRRGGGGNRGGHEGNGDHGDSDERGGSDDRGGRGKSGKHGRRKGGRH